MGELRYGIGEQDFKAFKEYGYVYIDKTQYIPELLKQRFYFLSRPRRFGKSLLLSTLEHFFLGNKSLFEGLAVENYDWDWFSYPVIRVDLSNGSFSPEGGLAERLYEILRRYEIANDIPPVEGTPRARLQNLIDNLYEKYDRRGVVILIDEYEKPLLDSHEEETFRPNRNVLAEFYSVIKENTGKIRFLFMTGVTRFGHLNIFSGLNNLRDISLDAAFTAICGITENELLTCLQPGVRFFAESNSFTVDEALGVLKKYYDGYHFSSDLTDIYNPFTLLQCLSSGSLSDAWANSGSTRFLLSKLRTNRFDISKLEGTTATGKVLLGTDADFMDPTPLLYQSGYLTIKAYNPQRRLYTLGIPNQEVREDLYESIIPYYLGKSGKFDLEDAFILSDYIREGKAEELMKWLKSFFAKVSYDTKFQYVEFEHERDFQFVVGAIMALATSLDDIQFEQQTSQGRIDMVVQTARFIYIFEFKLGNSARGALDQINSKDYALPWAAGNREVIKIGVAFSAEKRCISDYIINRS